MFLFYNKKGDPLTIEEYAELHETFEYRVIKQETLPNGLWVSTVWLGVPHGTRDGRPLIFESMCFRSRDNLDDMDCMRYVSEEEALAGHNVMVAVWSKCPKVVPDED